MGFFLILLGSLVLHHKIAFQKSIMICMSSITSQFGIHENGTFLCQPIFQLVWKSLHYLKRERGFYPSCNFFFFKSLIQLFILPGLISDMYQTGLVLEEWRINMLQTFMLYFLCHFFLCLHFTVIWLLNLWDCRSS